MSYEGYEQILCEEGHEHHEGRLFSREGWRCPDCGSHAVWVYSVDQTNGCDRETGEGMPVKLEVLEEAEHETCDKCGVTRQVEPARYKLPEKVEAIS